MKNLYEEFLQYIQKEDKEASLNFVLSKLSNGEVDIVTLYTQILSPALTSMVWEEKDDTFIWKEHIRSSIIRSIIENCYPYVIKERDEKYKLKNNKNIAVVCPAEEYHEIGARMIADFFTLAGYTSTFVGSNTPKEEFVKAIKHIKLDYLAISISNYFNLVTAKNTIEKIREADSKVTILVGGHAFKHNTNALKDMNADKYIETFQDILKLAKEEKP
jgi:methanogenic corrinoid protein MtbC1